MRHPLHGARRRRAVPRRARATRRGHAACASSARSANGEAALRVSAPDGATLSVLMVHRRRRPRIGRRQPAESREARATSARSATSTPWCRPLGKRRRTNPAARRRARVRAAARRTRGCKCRDPIPSSQSADFHRRAGEVHPRSQGNVNRNRRGQARQRAADRLRRVEHSGAGDPRGTCRQSTSRAMPRMGRSDRRDPEHARRDAARSNAPAGCRRSARAARRAAA